jgi:Proteasome maturation factor UMP1
MDDTAHIPIMNKPASLMEVGPNGNNLAAAAASRHPVDDLQRTMQQNPFCNLDYVRHVYGSGLAMRLATEQKIAAQHEQRGAAGIPNSGLYRDIVAGRDVQLDFADFLSLPENRPDVMKSNPHAVMERQLGM